MEASILIVAIGLAILRIGQRPRASARSMRAV
jgi:hypothetical protein